VTPVRRICLPLVARVGAPHAVFAFVGQTMQGRRLTQ